MNEEVLNTSLRKFLKVVGVTSQREIEKAIQAAIANGNLKGNEAVKAKVVLTIDQANLSHTIDGTIELE
jgi:ribosomal protein L1